mmetsp:Transcript_28532/g.59592  ORF Transcript_28532/g.59592 Transcript_28532/m.59592 type:complete len:80 (-) Transcript_28532:132-371(-)
MDQEKEWIPYPSEPIHVSHLSIWGCTWVDLLPKKPKHLRGILGMAYLSVPNLERVPFLLHDYAATAQLGIFFIPSEENL